MTMTIHTRHCTLHITTALETPGSTTQCRPRANDSLLDEAAFHLREALACLDRSESLIPAAYVDQALAMLRIQRTSRVSEG